MAELPGAGKTTPTGTPHHGAASVSPTRPTQQDDSAP